VVSVLVVLPPLPVVAGALWVALAYDRSFVGSKRRLSLKSSADMVVVAP
jgi:hypothetical protein